MIESKEIARRLCAAMDWREHRIQSVAVAKRCGVTPQAVHKWRRDGEIDFRRHLVNLSEATDVPPMFYIEPEPGMSAETQAVWKRLQAWSRHVAVLALCALLPFVSITESHAADGAVRSKVCVLCKIASALVRLIRRLTATQSRTSELTSTG